MYYSCYQCCCCIVVVVCTCAHCIPTTYLHITLGLLHESDLDALVEEMSSVSTKWESIGQELGVYKGYRTHIRNSYSTSHDCMREMLRKWLQDTLRSHNWERIILAVRRTGEPQLADNLKAKHIPGELTTTTPST